MTLVGEVDSNSRSHSCANLSQRSLTSSPLLLIFAAFVHFVWWRGIALSPSIAFTAVAVFSELRFALNALPETAISVLQGFVSLRRIEKVSSFSNFPFELPRIEADLSLDLVSSQKYLATAEIEPVAVSTSQKVSFSPSI